MIANHSLCCSASGFILCFAKPITLTSQTLPALLIRLKRHKCLHFLPKKLFYGCSQVAAIRGNQATYDWCQWCILCKPNVRVNNIFGCLLQGGFIRKRPEWKQVGKSFLLSVEDAQQPGKDIGSGTFHIRSIQQLLAACASTLHQCQAKHAQREAPVRREASTWAAVQVGHVCPTIAVFLVVRCPTVAVLLVKRPRPTLFSSY